MDTSGYNIHKYEIIQNGKKYILTSEIYRNNVRLSCVEVNKPNPLLFLNDFTLDYLRQLCISFYYTYSIQEAQDLINRTIEAQKISIENNKNSLNILLFIQNQYDTTFSLEPRVDIIYYPPIYLPTKTIIHPPIYINGPTYTFRNDNFYYGQSPFASVRQINDFSFPIETYNIPNYTYSSDLQGMLDLSNNETNKIKGENEILKNKINKLKGQIYQLNNQIVNLNEINKSLNNLNTNNEINKIKNEEEIQRLSRQIIEFKENIKIKEDQINDYEIKMKESYKNSNNLNIENKRLNQELNILKSQRNLINNDEIVKGEIMENEDDLQFLIQKICIESNKKIYLNLLYKASVDSDKASSFHNKCDRANNSLVLIKSGNGKRFGGYTSCSWDGNLNKKDEKAFIFSLDKKQIYDIIPGKDAIGCDPQYGPIFSGYQILIFDEARTKGGVTCEKGLCYDTKEDYELTGGLSQFRVKEIEVYSIEYDE